MLQLPKPLTYFYLDNVCDVFLFLKNFLVYYAKKSAITQRTNIHSLEFCKNFTIYAKNILYNSVVQLRARGTILQNLRLVDCRRRQPSIKRHGNLLGQNLGLRPIPSESFA